MHSHTFSDEYAEESIEIETEKKESILIELARSLTEKQKNFIIEYVKNGGAGKEAAIAAGYSEKTATCIACNLMQNDEIAYEIDRVKRIQCLRAEEDLKLGFQQRIKNVLEVRELALEPDSDGVRVNLGVAHKSNELIAKIFEDVDTKNTKNSNTNVQVNLNALKLVEEYKSEY